MVHVKIEVIELELRVLLPELAPCAYAYACGVPSELWRVGRLVEPEIALAQELYTVFLVEDGGVFASLLAVVATHTYIVVTVERGGEVAQLGVKHFLGSEYVGILKIDLVAYHLTSHVPYIARSVVTAVMVADVVSAYEERLGTRQ